MSNYIKATDFASKDTLPSGNAAKIVKGKEIDNEFNAIATAVNSKQDTLPPTFLDGKTDKTTQIITESTSGLQGGNTLDGDVTLSIKTSGVVANMLATDAVETAKIKNGAVTIDKLANTGVLPCMVVTSKSSTITTISPDTWTAAPLTNIEHNAISGATLANDAVTLPAGTYYFEMSVPVRCTNSDDISSAQTALFDGSTKVANGGTHRIGDWSTSTIQGMGTFTLTESKALKIKVLTSDNPAGQINGVAGYVSSFVKFWKIA